MYLLQGEALSVFFTYRLGNNEAALSNALILLWFQYRERFLLKAG